MATEYTAEQIQAFAERDVVFGIFANYDFPNNGQQPSVENIWRDSMGGTVYIGCYGSGAPAGETGSLALSIPHFMQRFSHDNRMVGLIRKHNSDGSFEISVMGSDSLYFSAAKYVAGCMTVNLNYETYESGEDEGKIKLDITLPTWRPPYDGNNYMEYYTDCNTNNKIESEDAYDFTPEWKDYDLYPSMNRVFSICGQYHGTNFQPYQPVVLNDDKEDTLIMGIGKPHFAHYTGLEAVGLGMLSRDIYDCMAGNMWELGNDFAAFLNASFAMQEHPPYGIVRPTPTIPHTTNGEFTCYFRPYNLILTESESSAQNYLRTGAIPSDAIIYPWDPDSFPVYMSDSSVPLDDEPDGNDPGEDGEPVKSFDNQVEPVPDYTPQRLTNNNLYWLTGAQLQGFVNWFWTDAGEVATVSDLWEKIQGLYNDLASAILAIRYMPVNISWIGGSNDTTFIKLGNIKYEPGITIQEIQKDNPVKQTIGEIDIKEEIDAIKTNGGFGNFTPYAQATLYLPFYGFLDLDNDLTMNTKIRVRALYDIISGCIQYDIFSVFKGNQFLVNSIPCKMAVDIPITLQSKGDRDSAIFQNVTSLVGNVMTGIAGAATGSPLGLVMGGSNMVSGISHAGSQSAPMTLKGAPQETGAFYSPNRCCLIIKRPNFIRPKSYKTRVGYPCNQFYALNDSAISGFTQIYNPKIVFSGNTFRENGVSKVMKPLNREVEEIYEALEKGVIL